MLLGTSPGGVNVWSAVRSALVSWYSGIKECTGETERAKMGEKEDEEEG